MSFIVVINYTFAVIVGILVCYQLLISLLALRANKQSDHEVEKNRKFAIIIYARNKEQISSRFLYSLSGLVYPKNKYDLIVIADSYADKILHTAEKMGAKKLVPPTEILQNNKNVILSWVFENILERDASYEGVILFDSDGLVSGNYLEVMNYYLEQGSEVIQCYQKNVPDFDSWAAKISKVEYSINWLVRPLGRKALRLWLLPQGNGICFSATLLREIPWQSEKYPNLAHYNFGLQLQGIEIDFAQSAELYTNTSQAKADNYGYARHFNRERYQLLKKYGALLFSESLKKKSYKYIDMLFELITPQFATIMFLIIIMSVLNGILLSLGVISTFSLLTWITFLFLGVTAIFLALVVDGSKNKIRKSIMYLPIITYGKIQSLLQWVFSGQEETEVENSRENEAQVIVADENHVL